MVKVCIYMYVIQINVHRIYNHDIIVCMKNLTFYLMHIAHNILV
jgi:hypothetical protein